jgi:hypothetical protein
MLEDLKLALGFENEDDREPLLNLIIAKTEQRLKNKLGGIETVPQELAYITFEVCIKRFNRIGSEGLASHSLEGEQLEFSDSDFNEFKEDIETWAARQEKDSPAKRCVKFI